jgi:serine/threonine-protein kinase HipA
MRDIRFFRLVVFNYIYGNGDDHLKNFSIIKVGNSYQLAPAYDLMNTCLHIEGDDFGLNGGLSLSLEKSDVYDRTGHPCRLDFERFGEFIGLKTNEYDFGCFLFIANGGKAISRQFFFGR